MMFNTQLTARMGLLLTMYVTIFRCGYDVMQTRVPLFSTKSVLSLAYRSPHENVRRISSGPFYCSVYKMAGDFD